MNLLQNTQEKLKVVLFEPQIPQNAGNIVRTCAVTGTDLILVKPLGFQTSDRMLKRAGLDYWGGVNVSFLDDLFVFLNNTTTNFYFFSSHAKKNYSQTNYKPNDLLIFGSETTGLPALYHKTWAERFLTIPMKAESRCLNLSNAVSIVLYEALRQNGFPNM